MLMLLQLRRAGLTPGTSATATREMFGQMCGALGAMTIDHVLNRMQIHLLLDGVPHPSSPGSVVVARASSLSLGGFFSHLFDGLASALISAVLLVWIPSAVRRLIGSPNIAGTQRIHPTLLTSIHIASALTYPLRVISTRRILMGATCEPPLPAWIERPRTNVVADFMHLWRTFGMSNGPFCAAHVGIVTTLIGCWLPGPIGTALFGNFGDVILSAGLLMFSPFAEFYVHYSVLQTLRARPASPATMAAEMQRASLSRAPFSVGLQYLLLAGFKAAFTLPSYLAGHALGLGLYDMFDRLRLPF